MAYHEQNREVNKLNQHLPKALVEIHPEDAVALGVEDGNIVSITSRRGNVQMKASLTTAIKSGVVFCRCIGGNY